MTHITGAFGSKTEADAAVLRLLGAGFDRNDIRLNVSDDDHKTLIAIHTTSDMFTAARRALHSGNETIEAD